MKDLIERQAAIDALDKRFDLIPMHQTTEILQLRKDLRDLPSVQLEGIRCNECKYYQGVHGAMGHAPCSYWNSGGVMWDWCCSQGEKYMSDLISRAEAIDAIDILKRNYPSSCFEDLCKAVDIAIKALSAQPDPLTDKEQ